MLEAHYQKLARHFQCHSSELAFILQLSHVNLHRAQQRVEIVIPLQGACMEEICGAEYSA